MAEKIVTKEEEGCVWTLGSPCCGETTQEKLFGNQIKVPICESHFEEHKIIVFLFNNKFDIEELSNQTPEWRKEQALTIQLSQLGNIDDVKP